MILEKMIELLCIGRLRDDYYIEGNGELDIETLNARYDQLTAEFIDDLRTYVNNSEMSQPINS